MFKTWGFKLVNLTLGGDGVSGLVQSEESNKKRSLALLGRHRPQEVKDKISKSSIGKILSEETKNKVRESIIKLQGRAIKQYSLKGEFIKEWQCIKDAAVFYNTDSSNIMNCCKKKRNRTTAVGYIWRYSDDYSIIEIDKSKYVYQLKDGKYIEYINKKQAAEANNIPPSAVSRCCSHKISKYKGMTFISYTEYINKNQVN
jgi:hypothetical protein